MQRSWSGPCFLRPAEFRRWAGLSWFLMVCQDSCLGTLWRKTYTFPRALFPWGFVKLGEKSRSALLPQEAEWDTARRKTVITCPMEHTETVAHQEPLLLFLPPLWNQLFLQGTKLLKRLFLSIELPCDLFWKSNDLIYDPIFKTLFSLIVYAYDNSILSFINVALYVINHKVRSLKSSSNVLFQDCFGHGRSFPFSYNF